MIDKKKIEEAAKKEEPEFLYSVRQDLNFIKGFKAGINWFKENLWHDAIEEPEEFVDILVETSNGIHSAYFTSKIYYINNADSIIDYECTKNEVSRWFYIEDLMKWGK